MGALCCNHAPCNVAKPAEANEDPIRPEGRPEHSPTFPHRHLASDLSEAHRRCLAHVEGLSWAEAARCPAGDAAVRLPARPGK